jgi:GNAT superfamily N-acetyltransferase
MGMAEEAETRVRAAVADDSEAVGALMGGLLRDGRDWTPEGLRVGAPEAAEPVVLESIARGLIAGQDGTSRLLVAEVAGRVAGCVLGQVVPEGGAKLGRCEYLYVAPAYRGRGLGRTLMERMEGWLAERGCAASEVEVAALSPTRAMYEGWGYGEVAVRMRRKLEA